MNLGQPSKLHVRWRVSSEHSLGGESLYHTNDGIKMEQPVVLGTFEDLSSSLDLKPRMIDYSHLATYHDQTARQKLSQSSIIVKQSSTLLAHEIAELPKCP